MHSTGHSPFVRLLAGCDQEPQLDCDVLVVGLGPAGGTAAAAAAEAGLDVIAVERRTQIGLPVQCAEFIPAPLGSYARAAGIEQQRIRSMRTWLPSGTVRETGFTGIMIDRAAFDAALAERAQQAGARLLTGAVFEGLAAGNRARVHCRGQRLQIRHALLIAADGPASRLAHSLGLPALKTVPARQYTVRLRRPREHTDIWLSPDYPGGYAWLFPKGEWANVGLGFDRRFAPDLKAPLDRLHRRLVASADVGEAIRCRTGGLIPVGGLRPALVHRNILFAGDAAGFTHPVSGAGIPAAVISGEAAGKACAGYLAGDAAALLAYEADMRDQFGASAARALRARQRLESVWNTPAAGGDAAHRQSWIAFDEYYESDVTQATQSEGQHEHCP